MRTPPPPHIPCVAILLAAAACIIDKSADTDDPPADTTAAAADSTTSDPPGIDVDESSEPDCSDQAIAAFDKAAHAEATSKLDLATLEQIDCPWNADLACVDGPIPDLASALVVRNGDLPNPREYALPDTLWLVWSNVELGCVDPFAAPLCAGQWRLAWPIVLPSWCLDIRDPEGYSSINSTWDHPMLIEYGDSECQTHTGAVKEGGNTGLEISHAPADHPAGAPQPGTLCSQCQIPGVNTQLAGEYTLQLCP